MKANEIDRIAENIHDLACIPIILDQMMESFGLEKLELDRMNEYKLVNSYKQITEILNLTIRIVNSAVKNFKDMIEEKDSNESEATTETTKNQK